MDNELDLTLVVKHIANGTLGENLCRICLMPLTNLYENIFTKVCKENEEYCIADILEELCAIQILDNDHYNVCSKCFVSAWDAYKFYLKAKRNDELLHLYTNNLLFNVDSIEMAENIKPNASVCISLPILSSNVPVLDSDPTKVCIKKRDTVLKLDKEIKVNEKDGQTIKYLEKELNKKPTVGISKEPEVTKMEIKVSPKDIINKPIKTEADDDDDDLVVVIKENGQTKFFKMQPDGKLAEIPCDPFDDKFRKVYRAKEQSPRKKREPMTYKKCTRCSVQYRFVAKLREHMCLKHKILLYSCKLCEALVEGEDEYFFHIRTHTTEYKCDLCDTLFNKRDAMIYHLKQHDKIGKQSNVTQFVCTECGEILDSAKSLDYHVEEHSLKQYNCYYCGRMYKREVGFNKHIREHEKYMKLKELRQKQGEKQSASEKRSETLFPRVRVKGERKPPEEFTCEVCGRTILSARALMWHRQLHTNERPYQCSVCNRGFITANRCKQHELCAHTVPKLRCPLCPGLFHLRSMVNTHIKKVHLKKHKRRPRTVRHRQEVMWDTETVPVRDLSVALQSDILELQVQGTQMELD